MNSRHLPGIELVPDGVLRGWGVYMPVMVMVVYWRKDSARGT